MGVSFEEDCWSGALDRIPARLSLIQFKGFHRIHFSNARLSETFPNLEEADVTCHASQAHLKHMFLPVLCC